MKKSQIFILSIVCCLLILPLGITSAAEEETSVKENKESTPPLLVIPNLRQKKIGPKTASLLSNVIRTEVARLKTYQLIDHRPLFKKQKGTESRDEIIAMCKETDAEIAVLGYIKKKRALNYLKLVRYNLKTDKVEKKVVTAISSGRIIELKSVSRGAALAILGK